MYAENTVKPHIETTLILISRDHGPVVSALDL